MPAPGRRETPGGRGSRGWSTTSLTIELIRSRSVLRGPADTATITAALLVTAAAASARRTSSPKRGKLLRVRSVGDTFRHELMAKSRRPRRRRSLAARRPSGSSLRDNEAPRSTRVTGRNRDKVQDLVLRQGAVEPRPVLSTRALRWAGATAREAFANAMGPPSHAAGRDRDQDQAGAPRAAPSSTRSVRPSVLSLAADVRGPDVGQRCRAVNVSSLTVPGTGRGGQA